LLLRILVLIGVARAKERRSEATPADKPHKESMETTQLLQGTLDLLILRVLALGPLHGLGIADRIAQVTGGALQIKAGSLFPALYRLEAEGLVSGSWGASRSGRRAKLYTLTKQGRKHFAAEKKSWARASLAVQQVLEM
jgi:transcriptional regulator